MVCDSKQQALDLVVLLNSLEPSIRITHTLSQHQCEFLDLVIEKVWEPTWPGKSGDDGCVRLRTRTHQKPLNRYLYIPYTSHHPPSIFTSFIHAELVRYVVTCTDEHWFQCMVDKFTHRLRQRGYPLALIQGVIDRVRHTDRARYLAGRTPTPGGSTLALSLPYAGVVPALRPQARLYHAYKGAAATVHTTLPTRPIIAFKRQPNLGSLLVRASD